MAEAMHPLAPHHLPGFITPPGETDPFLTGAAVFLVVIILLVGSLYFRLHALPEKIAHRGASHQQFQLVAVLSLLALFTHNNAFWVAALLLAFIPIPDFWGPLANMAESLGRMANRRSRSTATGDEVVGSGSDDVLQPQNAPPEARLVADHPVPNKATAGSAVVSPAMADKAPADDKTHIDGSPGTPSLSNLSGPLPAGGSKP